MSTPAPQIVPNSQLLRLTLRACQVAQMAAKALTESMDSGGADRCDEIRLHEEELDQLDRQINEDVTAAVARGSSGAEARELLACLKFILDLERIGDLLLNVANRLQTVGGRLQERDKLDLSQMSAVLASMLGNATEAFANRDIRRALDVLKADADLDRVRNLIFARHIENPENQHRQESFHVVFTSQALERAGDHAKNLAEEICHLVCGRSVRHVLREYDRPAEQVYLERIRRSKPERPAEPQL